MAVPDLVILLDPHLPAAEARSVVRLLEVLTGRGFTCGLIPVLSPLSVRVRPFAADLRRITAARAVSLIDPDGRLECRLLVAWHIAPLLGQLDRPLQITAAQAVLRFDQLPWGVDDLDQASINSIRLNFARLLAGGSYQEVAADPWIASLMPTIRDVWWPPVAPSEDRASPVSGKKPVVGRHGGIGNVAWPMDAVAFMRAYPAGPDLQIDLLDPPLRPVAHRIARTSPYLRLIPPDAEPLERFLGRLDTWHLASWRTRPQPVTAEIMEAAASGVPLSLPCELRGWPADAANFHVGEFRELHPDRHRMAARAIDHVRAEAGPKNLADRLKPLGLSPRMVPGAFPPAGRPSRRTILMISPNGIGMGHLTRLLAVARRLPGHIEPVFLTMSQALQVVGRYGFHAEYLPYHAYYGGDPDYWNRGLLARLLAMVSFYDPRCILFDGNMPYAAFSELRRTCPERLLVWLRRGLWRPEAGKVAIERSDLFDMVIEPGEFAGEADRGLTRLQADRVVHVPPVILLDHDEVLDRDAARRELGIAPDATAVVVLLGSQNNFDYGPIRTTLAARLAHKPDIVLVEAEWLISEAAASILLPNARPLSGYPLARLFRAFDFAVSAAGYNSFHELLALGIPTIFVPNENPSMDEQETRALWAERNGLGVVVRGHETDRLAWALDAIRQPDVGAGMTRNSARLPRADGAGEVARLIVESMSARNALEDDRTSAHLRPHAAPLVS